MAATELWLVDLDKTERALEALEAATPRLSEDILLRLGEMGDETARRERRLAHIALRLLLEARLGPGIRRVPFQRSATGKPSLADRRVAFSLAHARGLALIAIGDSDPLGADIERLRPVRVPEARRAPIEAEAVVLAAGAPLAGDDADTRFLHAWVRTEAAAKAQGLGIGPFLERLRPGHAASPETAVASRPGAPSIVVHDVPMPGGVLAAIALATGLAPPPLRTLLLAAEGTRR